MKDIAHKALAGHVPDAKQIAKMSEKEIYDRLTQIRGVGPWTVDMLLIFTLRRPDILPSNDYGVRKGFQVLYRKRAMPSPKLLLKTAELWRPYRTTAALYLWRIADSSKQAKSLLK
jgi:3-methyladenine DNA glycosylase/8-oxoguanine DNA glycosylase